MILTSVSIYTSSAQSSGSHGLEIDNLKTPVYAGIPAATFDRVTGLVVRNSPVMDQVVSAEKSKPGTGTKSKK